MSEKLDRMKDQKEKAEQKLRYYQHQEKMLERRIPELTRKARTIYHAAYKCRNLD